MSQKQRRTISAECLIKRHEDKPISWWAEQLTAERERTRQLQADLTKYKNEANEAQAEAEIVEEANRNMAAVLKKYGAKISCLRITRLTATCDYDFDCVNEDIWCTGCEHSGSARIIHTENVFTYRIDSTGLSGITAEMRDFWVGIGDMVKVEDITNPKHPTVLFSDLIEEG